MVANNTGINYRETYFETKDLTPIAGEPNAESILRLKNELKANARSVHSNLGGGIYGHLGLILTPQQYALISNVPFDRPAHPGPLVIPPNTTQHMSNTLRDAHNEAIRIFNEVQGVDKALLQQLIEAIEPQFLFALRNRQTNSITLPLHEVLEYLTDTYGRVTPQMLAEKSQDISQMSYTVNLPIDIVFNAVEDLADFAELAGTPLTQPQTVQYAYLILLRTGRFTNHIREWNRRQGNQRNWTNFKTFFRQAYQELKETTDLTLEDAERRQQTANIAQQVVEGLQDFLGTQTEATAVPDPPPPPPPNAMMQQMANAVTEQTLIPQLLQQMQAMQTQHLEQMQTIMSQLNPGTQAPNNNRNRRQQFRRNMLNTSKYCWTHGACNHHGRECRHKAEGHQDEATFDNRMGGSNRNLGT